MPARDAITVIAVAGPAGSGKTTLGRALASRLRLPILDLDQLTNPLLDRLSSSGDAGDAGDGGGRERDPHWLAGADAGLVREGRYAVLRAAAADIVAAGVSVVLVAPFTAELTAGREWDQLCQAVSPATVTVVHLDGDPDVLRARRALRGEARDAFRRDTSPTVPVVKHIGIDAALSTQQQLFRATLALGYRAPVDRDNPVLRSEFDAVLFDLDGTLVDSTSSVVRAWSRLAGELGFDPAEVQSNHGKPALPLLRRLLAADLVPDAIARITQLEAEDTHDVLALPGAVAMLSALPSTAKAIVTSGGREVATARIAAGGLPPVDVVVTADDVTGTKPDPEPYLLGARRLGVAPERCLAIEDAPAGIEAAKRAGCIVVAVGGTCDPAELSASLWLDGLDRVRVVRRGSGFGLELADDAQD